MPSFITTKPKIPNTWGEISPPLPLPVALARSGENGSDSGPPLILVTFSYLRPSGSRLGGSSKRILQEGSPGASFWMIFARFLEPRTSPGPPQNHKKPRKNTSFSMILLDRLRSAFLHLRGLRGLPKPAQDASKASQNTPKVTPILPKPLPGCSRGAQKTLKRPFKTSQDASKTIPGASKAPFWGCLGASWPCLGCPWAILGPSWGALGSILGLSWCSWMLLGRSWGSPGAPGGLRAAD